jgi:hypothetical protein
VIRRPVAWTILRSPNDNVLRSPNGNDVVGIRAISASMLQAPAPANAK